VIVTAGLDVRKGREKREVGREGGREEGGGWGGGRRRRRRMRVTNIGGKEVRKVGAPFCLGGIGTILQQHLHSLNVEAES
jgi:hypothetical protein